MSDPRGRPARITTHSRHSQWHLPPVRIDVSRCVECSACVQSCPPAFGAVFVFDGKYHVVAELCSGCGKCVEECPVQCIQEMGEPRTTADERWRRVGTVDDPYLGGRSPRRQSSEAVISERLKRPT